MTYSNRWNRVLYTLWAPAYDVMLRLHPVTRLREGAFAQAGAANANSLLLVGVGTGADLAYLQSSTTVIGIDLSTTMLRRSIRAANRHRLVYMPICADAARLPFHDDRFDVVALSLIVSVVPQPRACLDEAVRVTRPGGKIVILDKFLPPGQSPSWIRRAVNSLTRFFGTDINRRWEHLSKGLRTIVVDEAAPGHPSIRTIIVQKESPAQTGKSLL